MSQKIGFWSVFAIVTGSQIGSGVFMLPATLAPYGAYSILGWVLSGLGAIALALVFAGLCTRFPRTGGPHVYVKEMFGPSASFFTGWTYWVISWVSTTAVVVTSIGYLSPFIGDQSPLVYLGVEITLLLAITWLNFKGIKAAGEAEFILTLLKIIPLIILPIAACWYFDTSNFMLSEQVTSQHLSKTLAQVTLLTLWGFIGVETATAPAGSVENPSKTIPRAIISGTLCVALLYLLNSVGIMGLVPGEVLELSKAPYSEVTQYIFGGHWHLLISVMASIVCITTLNAWMLTSGQIALGLAEEGLMPKQFSVKNENDAPTLGLIISCLGILFLLVLTLSNSMAKQITAIIDLSVVAFLFVYLVCVASYLKALLKERASFSQWIYGLIAFGFCAWIIYETPLKTMGTSSLFVLSGIPVYFFWYKQQKKKAIAVAVNA